MRRQKTKSKPISGQIYRNLERPSVYKGISLALLCSSGMKGETENVIIAAQYQPLKTYYHQMNIMKQTTDSKCRMLCCKAEEHIRHIVEGCTTLVPFEYANRHSKVAGYIHWTMFKHTGL
jgi:hypothetical protein